MQDSDAPQMIVARATEPSPPSDFASWRVEHSDKAVRAPVNLPGLAIWRTRIAHDDDPVSIEPRKRSNLVVSAPADVG